MNKALIPIAILLAALVLVACGGDDDDDSATPKPNGGAEKVGGGGGGGGGETLKLTADPDGALAFDTKQLSAKAGDITIELDNPAPVSHNVEVEDPASGELGVSDTITEDTTTLQLTDVKPGEYEFYCNVPGHQEGGMEGTLSVK